MSFNTCSSASPFPILSCMVRGLASSQSLRSHDFIFNSQCPWEASCYWTAEHIWIYFCLIWIFRLRFDGLQIYLLILAAITLQDDSCFISNPTQVLFTFTNIVDAFKSILRQNLFCVCFPGRSIWGPEATDRACRATSWMKINYQHDETLMWDSSTDMKIDSHEIRNFYLDTIEYHIRFLFVLK